MSVLLIVGLKCTPAAPHAAPLVSHAEYAPRALLRLEKKTGQTDGRTDGRTPVRYSTLTVRLGHRNNVMKWMHK